MKTPRTATTVSLLACFFALLFSVHAGLQEIEGKYRTIYAMRVKKKYGQEMATLKEMYIRALAQTMQRATKDGQLENAVAFRDELMRLKENSPVPKNKPEACPELAKLRQAYQARLAKLTAEKNRVAAPILKQFSEELAKYQDTLTKAGKLDEAMTVKAYREKDLEEQLQSDPVAAGPASPAPLPKRWFGHCIESDPALVGSFERHVNCVFDHGWPEYDDALIKSARESNIRVILMFRKETQSAARKKGFALAKNNPDVVAAMCWESPYFDNSTPSDLTRFAKKLKKAAPGVQFWGQFVEKPRGNLQTLPVPPEVDAIVIANYFATRAQNVERKADEAMPGWLEKANGRPVMLYWCAWTKETPGLVSRCRPGTMKACAVVAEKYGLSGLVLGHYGKRWKHAGIETQPHLQKEIAEVARKFCND